MRVGVNQALKRLARQSVLWVKIAVLVYAGLAPALMTDKVGAEQITSREVLISTSESGALNVEYDFTFSWTSTGSAVQSVIFQFCDTPLGTCNLPNGMDLTSTTLDGDTNFPGGNGIFSEEASPPSGDCNDMGGAGDTMYCITGTGSAGAATGATVDLGGIENPTISTGAYISVYVRISLYSDTAYSTKVHEGTVAAAITQQLTSVGRVAERLQFCVGAQLDDDPLPDSCDDSVNTFPTETNIDLGVIVETDTTASPVEPAISNANLANDRYGLLMVNTNASGGVVIQYFPEVADSVSNSDTDQLRSFRVVPTDCSVTTTSETDQCFVSASTSGSTFAANTEMFGMAVACINDQGTTSNFLPANGGTIGAGYGGDQVFTDDVVGFADDCENETANVASSYEWGFDDDVSDGIATIASTASSTVKVVDDEAIKIRFGAIASPTTPTGTYSVVTTYIATPTF